MSCIVYLHNNYNKPQSSLTKIIPTMTDLHNLESIQVLHADLKALSESRLSNIEKLEVQLEDHIRDFRAFLDKKVRCKQSRDTLDTGTHK